MNDWNGKWTIIYRADNDTGRFATKVIEGFNLQTWPNRELVIVNSSEMDFGGYGYTEVAGSTIQHGVSKATGEYCLEVTDWQVLQHPNLLFQLSQLVGTKMRIRAVKNGFTVAVGFFRRAAHLAYIDQTPLVDVEFDTGGVIGNKLTNTVVSPPDTGSLDPTNINLLCPAGIGDILWIVYKMKVYANLEARHGKKVVFWLPGQEQRRSGGLLRMFGLHYGYLDSLTTPWVWSQPGNPDISDHGGIYTVHANRHLEAGNRIEEWYPQITGCYPPIRPLLQTQQKGNYVSVFMCMNAYMGGQLKPVTWANIIERIESEVAPVMLVGAGKDVAFAREVEGCYRPALAPMYDCPVEEVIDSMSTGLASIGVASGLMIVSEIYGPRTLMAYPQHLDKMPGSWETKPSEWCLVGDLKEKAIDWIKTL